MTDKSALRKCSHGGIVTCPICGKYKGDNNIAGLYREVMTAIDRIDAEAVDEAFARYEGRPPRSYTEIDEALND